MNVKELISNSNLAFLNEENETALNLAKEAIKLEPKNPDTYKCAANAYMSMENYEEAIKNFMSAAKCDPTNGNRYYDLGYALASNEKLADAMKSFAKAEELGCTPENTYQLYNVLGIICFDIGRYDDALINLTKAEKIIGVDLDILQRKAIIYGLKDDIRNGLMTANQMKLISPSEYRGYQIAVKLLMQAKRLDDARKELRKADKFAAKTMDYYFDCMSLELEQYQVDQNKQHYNKALTIIEEALKSVEPTPTNVIESYINAAEIYQQLEKPDLIIDCLNAAQNPCEAYNNKFDVLEKQYETHELTDYDVEDMMQEDRENIAEEFGEYGLEELVETVEPDEDGNREYFTEIEEEQQEDKAGYKLEEEQDLVYSPEIIDQINRLYVGAYTLKKDFNRVIDYARKLQTSESIQNSYIGTYMEANAMKELGSPDANKKYADVIKYFRNIMIKDPTDIMAVTYRIQCYIDIKRYDEAERICDLLSKDTKEALLEKINEAKLGDE